MLFPGFDPASEPRIAARVVSGWSADCQGIVMGCAGRLGRVRWLLALRGNRDLTWNCPCPNHSSFQGLGGNTDHGDEGFCGDADAVDDEVIVQCEKQGGRGQKDGAGVDVAG